MRIISLKRLLSAILFPEKKVVVKLTRCDVISMIDIDCFAVHDRSPERYSGMEKVKKVYYLGQGHNNMYEVCLLECEKKALAKMCNDYCLKIASDFIIKAPEFYSRHLVLKYEFGTIAYLKMV